MNIIKKIVQHWCKPLLASLVYWVRSHLGFEFFFGISKLKVENFVDIKFGIRLWNHLLLKLKLQTGQDCCPFYYRSKFSRHMNIRFFKSATTKPWFWGCYNSTLGKPYDIRCGHWLHVASLNKKMKEVMSSFFDLVSKYSGTYFIVLL